MQSKLMRVRLIGWRDDTPPSKGGFKYFRDKSTDMLLICQDFVERYLGSLPACIVIQVSKDCFKGSHKAQLIARDKVKIISKKLVRKTKALPRTEADMDKYSITFLHDAVRTALEKIGCVDGDTFYWGISSVCISD